MRLTRVQFDNYKKFRNTNIKLNEKATILIGQNDSGKSTLLRGIYDTLSETDISKNSKYFSKVLQKDASVKIFFKIEKEELYDVLDELSLVPEKKD